MKRKQEEEKDGGRESQVNKGETEREKKIRRNIRLKRFIKAEEKEEMKRKIEK